MFFGGVNTTPGLVGLSPYPIGTLAGYITGHRFPPAWLGYVLAASYMRYSLSDSAISLS